MFGQTNRERRLRASSKKYSSVKLHNLFILIIIQLQTDEEH